MISRSAIFFVIALPIAAHAQYVPQRVYMVHSLGKTCPVIGELDRALDLQDARYFAGWTNLDYNVATQWAAACVASGYEYVGAGRAARLHAYQAKAAQPPPAPASPPLPPSPEKLAAEAAARQQLALEQEKWRQQEAEEGRREAAETAVQERTKAIEAKKRQARADAIAACRHSDAYHVFQAQQRLRADIDIKDRLAEVIEHEQKIEDRSGVRNLSLDYELGARSVRIDEVIEKDRANYHLAGGRSTQDEGLRLIENPCTGNVPNPDK
jgi:hypothetical protein